MAAEKPPAASRAARDISARLKQARARANRTGEDVASAAARRADTDLTWPILRQYETAQALPTSTEADALASTLNVSLEWVLGLIASPSPEQPRERATPSKPVPSPAQLAPLRARLENAGHDPDLALQFAEFGIPSAVLRQWLQRFDPKDALAWLGAGLKPYAAWQATQAGLTPETAGGSQAVASEGAAELMATAVPEVIAKTWMQYSDARTGLSWLNAGWDLLAALAWVDTGLEPADALAWHSARVLPRSQPTAASMSGQPEAAALWVATGLAMADWPKWIKRSFTPAEAEQWTAQSVPAAEAVDYRRLVGHVERSGWYRANAVGPHAAARWESTRLNWDQIQVWVPTGIEPEDAQGYVARNVTPARAQGERQITGRPIAPQPAPDPPMSAADRKAVRVQLQAAAFQLTTDEFVALRTQVHAAESNLTGTGEHRRTLAARRLSITGDELKVLRRALNVKDVPEAHSPQARQLARHVVALAPLRTGFGQSAPKAPPNRPGSSPGTVKPKVTPAQGAISPIKRSIVPSRYRDWNASTSVYITPQGDVIHRYHDCHGMRGFRHPNEADPVVEIVSLRDPVCAERRACRKCFDWSPSTLKQLDEFIEGLHGRAPVQRPKAPKVRKKRRRSRR